MQGRLAEPGTGLPLCTARQVEEDALNQLQLTPDWSGERFAIRTENDSEIRHAYALRPDRAQEEESAERQLEYGKAAALLVRAIHAATVPQEDRYLLGR